MFEGHTCVKLILSGIHNHSAMQNLKHIVFKAHPIDARCYGNSDRKPCTAPAWRIHVPELQIKGVQIRNKYKIPKTKYKGSLA